MGVPKEPWGDPSVAVCIPARRAGARLERVLRALQADEFEGRRAIYVGLDGPDRLLEEQARSAGAEVVVLNPAAGSYAARNAVLRSLPSSIEFVLFTDADCLPLPGWTDAHLKALADADLSGGAIQFELSSAPRPAEFIDSMRNLQQERYVRVGGWAATANLGATRRALEGGFDETIRSGGDQAFCRQAVKRGLRLTYTPNAVVLHPPRRTIELLRKSVRVARGLATASELPSSRPQSLRPSRSVVVAARTQGIAIGRSWAVRAVLLDWANGSIKSIAHRFALKRAKHRSRRAGRGPER